jgi:hypothetical protein
VSADAEAPAFENESKDSDELLRLRRRGRTVLLAEAIDTTFGVHQLLFAREEGVAGRADVDADFFLGRTRFERVPADANNGSVSEILRVDAFFHNYSNGTKNPEN